MENETKETITLEHVNSRKYTVFIEDFRYCKSWKCDGDLYELMILGIDYHLEIFVRKSELDRFKKKIKHIKQEYITNENQKFIRDENGITSSY